MTIALAIGAATAEAAVSFRFEGRGYGHGVGLSQYGARGAALAGLEAPAILRHYYPGTQIGTAPGGAVRVRIVQGRRALTVGGGARMRVLTAGGRATILPARRRFRATVAGQAVRLHDARGRLRLRAATMRLTPVRAASVRVGGRRFRGAIFLFPVRGNRLEAVNRLSMDFYLASVLPSAVPARWGDRTPAALEAVAIAARSYTLGSQRPGGRFDIRSNATRQVYAGAGAEDPRTTAAVRATRGRVVTYDGRVVQTPSFSTSGGHTEASENIFGGDPVPFLRGVPDPYDYLSPYHRRWPDPPWVDAARLGELLGLGAPVQTFTVTRRGVSPRVLAARVTTTDGAVHDVTGEELRRSLGLRDTWFRVIREDRRAPREGPTSR